MIVVTGATGNLGRLVVESLLERGVAASDIVAAVRNPDKAAGLAARGVQIREADFDRPDTLNTAFAGADKILLVSGNDEHRRVAQHKAVVDAAKTAGVRLLAYTSALHADTAPLGLAPHHKITEEYIRESGVPFSFLRNNLYTEVLVPSVLQALNSGVIVGASGNGRVASASRADYAAAAAVVLADEGHENTVYELGGDDSWSKPDLAATAAEVSRKAIAYQDLPLDQYAQALVGAGLPEPAAQMLARNDADIAAGLLDDTTGELSRLIGRPTTSLRKTLAVALSN